MSEPTAKASLPSELHLALDRFQRKWRLLNTLTVLGLLALIPLLSLTFLSVSDRLWETPGWARFILAIPVPICMVLSSAPWIRRWILDRPGPERVARFMGSLDPRVGDRLLGAVELANGGNESWSGSAALRQAAILQVASELSNVHSEDKLDSKKVRKILLSSAALFSCIFIYVIFSPDAAQNSFKRWLKPYQEIERFTFVRLSGFPKNKVVAHGEPFELSGKVSHVKNQPVEEVQSNVNGPEQVEVSVVDSKVAISAEGMTQNREITLRSGDAKATIKIEPLLRPELLAMSASVIWPAYLNMDAEDLVMRRRRLEVPIGSEVAMKGTVSRELESVNMGNATATVIQGAGFEMPRILVETNVSLSLNWVDNVGLKPRQATAVELIAKADVAPAVSMTGIGSTVAVLQDEFLEVDISARDDFRLKQVWAQFKQSRDVDGPELMTEEIGITGASGAQTLVFSPERLGFGPDSLIELIALAVDDYPGRVASESSKFRILVLSTEDHAKMLLQQMDRVLAELDESIRQESLSLEANKATAERDEADLMDESTTETLLDRALDELARAEQLGETHKGIESLIAEATKNELIKDKQIAEWAEISENLKKDALPAMGKAAKSMKNAAEAKGAGEAEPASGIVEQEAPESERKKQLDEAIGKQEEALEAMKRGEEDLDESIVNSLSESFINRFKVLGEKQLTIRNSLNEILPKTIGLNTDQLPEDLRRKISENADLQDEIFRESRYIYDDLEGFFRRTQTPELRQVTSEMKDEDYSVRLPDLKEMILLNTIGKTTSESTEWNRLFLKWANDLSEDPPPPSEGEGGAPPDEEGESLETMIALIRAREQQEKLRRHTRSLNESYAENLSFDRDAVVLSDRQYELAQTLLPLENRVVKDETKKLVSLASGEMLNVGVQLRQSITGQESITLQTAVIELLAKALDQSMGGEPPPEGGEPQQNSAAMMQAIMEMMAGASAKGEGMPGTAGGEGSTGFGDPGQNAGSSGSSSGSSRGQNTDGRGIASDPENWPGRYRSLMDTYFEAMEAER